MFICIRLNNSIQHASLHKITKYKDKQKTTDGIRNAPAFSTHSKIMQNLILCTAVTSKKLKTYHITELFSSESLYPEIGSTLFN